MSKSNITAIQKELGRWLIASRKIRNSAGIAYGKIKSHMTVIESSAPKEVINKVQSEIGLP